MREPRVSIRRTGDVVLGHLEMPFVFVLRELPALLAMSRDDERARRRLFPDAYDDEESNAQWRRHGAPEIRDLFRSSMELVEEDLATLESDPSAKRSWRLRIPARHHTAWMTSLNCARLALGEVHRLSEEDLDHRRALDPGSERDLAVWKVHLLGWIEELLVAAADRPAEPQPPGETPPG